MAKNDNKLSKRQEKSLDKLRKKQTEKNAKMDKKKTKSNNVSQRPNQPLYSNRPNNSGYYQNNNNNYYNQQNDAYYTEQNSGYDYNDYEYDNYDESYEYDDHNYSENYSEEYDYNEYDETETAADANDYNEYPTSTSDDSEHYHLNPRTSSPIREALDIMGLYWINEHEYTMYSKEVRDAYKIMAKRYHPDLNKTENAMEEFLWIKKAYEKII